MEIDNSKSWKTNPLNYVFEFYSKQSYTTGKHHTFERQLYETNRLNLQKLMQITRDFSLDKNLILLLFKKVSLNSRDLSLSEFQLVLEQYASKQGTTLQELQQQLGMDTLANCKRKIHPLKALDIKQLDPTSGINYKFRLFHPQIKEEQELKQILEQRKQEQILAKSEERKRKEMNKLRHEMKLINEHELVQKYPQKSKIIQELKQLNMRQYTPEQVRISAYRQTNEKKISRSNQIRKIDRNLITEDHHIQQLIPDDNESDNIYLAEYKIINEALGKKKSTSDYEQAGKRCYYAPRQLPPLENTRRKPDSNDISVYDRVQRKIEGSPFQDKHAPLKAQR